MPGWRLGLPNAETLQRPEGDAEAGKAAYAACAACHGQNGEGNQALYAPKLAGQEDWYMRQQLQAYKTGVRGSNEEDIYGQQMRGMAMTLPTPEAVENVIAYIQTLPDVPAPATITGDIERGQKIYRNCASCHGRDGMGAWSVNAPRQAGMSDWYLAEQLKNFKKRIRGGHPDDGFGWQMGMMADTLQDDAAVNDVVAYINTL